MPANRDFVLIAFEASLLRYVQASSSIDDIASTMYELLKSTLILLLTKTFLLLL